MDGGSTGSDLLYTAGVGKSGNREIACPRSMASGRSFGSPPSRIVAIASKPQMFFGRFGTRRSRAQVGPDASDAPMMSCSTILFRYFALPRETRTAHSSSRLTSSPRPPLDRRGSCRRGRARITVCGSASALRRTRFAAAVSRRAANRESIVCRAVRADKDICNVPSPGHRSRPPAGSSYSSAGCGGSASQFLGIGLDPTEVVCRRPEPRSGASVEIPVADRKHQMPTNGPRIASAVKCRP